MRRIDKEKQLGLLYGCAIGDSWGMATEMMTYDNILKSNFNKDILNPSLSESIISKGFEAGSITDDTINTLLIMKMLKDNNGHINTNDYIRHLIYWTKNSPIAGYVTGPSTSKALEKILNNEPIETTGIMGTTNGAAMKIAPLGIVLDYKNLDNLIENVYKICIPTHNTTIAIQGACSIVVAVSYLLMDNDNYDELLSLIEKTINKAKVFGFNWPSADLYLKIKKAINIVYNYTDFLEILYKELGTTMETIDTIPIALSLFMYSKGNINICKKLTSTIGGDTDTIGAIACALCGSQNPSLIKKEDIEIIERVNNINFSEYLL